MLPHHARVVYLGGVVKRALHLLGIKGVIVRYVDDKGVQLRKFARAVEEFGNPKDPVEAGRLYHLAKDLEPTEEPARIQAVRDIIAFYGPLEEKLGGKEDAVYWESDGDEFESLEVLRDLDLLVDLSNVGGEVLFSTGHVTFPLVRENGESTFKLRYLHFVMNHLPGIFFLENRLHPLGEAVRTVARRIGKPSVVIYCGRSLVNGRPLKGREFNWVGYELESLLKMYDPKVLSWHFLSSPLEDFPFGPERDAGLLLRILSRPARESVFSMTMRERWHRFLLSTVRRPTKLSSTIRTIWGAGRGKALEWWDELLWLANLLQGDKDNKDLGV